MSGIFDHVKFVFYSQFPLLQDIRPSNNFQNPGYKNLQTLPLASNTINRINYHLISSYFEQYACWLKNQKFNLSCKIQLWEEFCDILEKGVDFFAINTLM